MSNISKEIENAPIRFGLEAQGHMATIETMLGNGHTWDQIADQIGWERCTARTHYEARIGDAATRKLRSSLAEAIEVLRMVHKRFGRDFTGELTNRMTSAYMHGNGLLDSKTKYDF